MTYLHGNCPSSAAGIATMVQQLASIAAELLKYYTWWKLALVIATHHDLRQTASTRSQQVQEATQCNTQQMHVVQGDVWCANNALHMACEQRVQVLQWGFAMRGMP
jgi:hypothetical protein